MIKRLFDIVVSLTALLILAVPLLLCMVILKCTGEHQVWYFQPRVGKDGKHFRLFKFATMRKNSEFTGTGDITVRADPRVLPFGRILRKTKINELPQLLNVLNGTLSIVGWRPLMPEGFSYYPPDIQEQIVKIKPGLTGIGSVIFRDEEGILELTDKPPRQVYREDIAPYKGAVELWYQKHQSFWLDMKIIFLTAWAILRPDSRLYLKWFKDLPKPRSPLIARYIYGQAEAQSAKPQTSPAGDSPETAA